MTKKFKKTVTILSIVFLNVLMSFAGTTQQWKEIMVDVTANGTVSTTNSLKEIENGFPIIAVIDVPAADYDHWVALYGYRQKSSTARWVYLNNNKDEEVMPFKKFQRLHTNDYMACWGKV